VSSKQTHATAAASSRQRNGSPVHYLADDAVLPMNIGDSRTQDKSSIKKVRREKGLPLTRRLIPVRVAALGISTSLTSSVPGGVFAGSLT
jgi:hypothetical protein